MNKKLAALAALIVGIGMSATSLAQMPSPRYVKKAVFVRIHFDWSFYSRWYGSGDLNTRINGYFNTVRSAYLNNGSLHNIDLILLNDFDRMSSPMMNYRDDRNYVRQNLAIGELGGNGRLIKYMRDNLSTGVVTKRIRDVTHDLGRSVNWVLTYQPGGSLAGEANALGGLGSADANLFVTTSAGGWEITPGGARQTFSDMRQEWIAPTLAHELGHLLNATHENAEGCGGSNAEIMCSGANLQYRFGNKNFTRSQLSMSRGLQRRNSAFSNVNTCNAKVDEECSRILDYSQIAACQANGRLVNCSDICTTAQKQARVVINSLPAIINGSP